jgi:hypothetical protein
MRLLDTRTGLPVAIPPHVQTAIILIWYYTCQMTLGEIGEYARQRSE